MISAILLIIITIFSERNLSHVCKTGMLTISSVPPIGVYCVAGCGADLLINIALTILGYFPGHIHALVAPTIGRKALSFFSFLGSMDSANLST